MSILRIYNQIKWTAIILGSAAGVVWVVNLPYPMIRLPVAKTAPILLLPSFISMDHHYRGALAAVEQADQLINKATANTDIERGAQKVAEAQQHLDSLPVWFLGYYPQMYCGFVGCGWKFTLDEFQTARTNVARMEAKVFQEKNAFKLLTQADLALNKAKLQYQQAKNTQEQRLAIASMQGAIDQLEQIPKETVYSGQNAQNKLKAYKRDFEQIVHHATETNRDSTLIEAAKPFALAATESAQNPPHTAVQWQQIENLWLKAIEQLQKIRTEEPSYVDAQKLLAQYQVNVDIIQTRMKAETDSVNILLQANQSIQRLITYPPASNQLRGELQAIITQLRSVQSGTTAYLEAQTLLREAENKLSQSKSK